MNRRDLLSLSLAFLAASRSAAAQTPPESLATKTWQQRLIVAARQQIGETTRYVPAYVRIAYPGGDIPRETGVCTDVIVRAYRDAFGIDLQKLVHEDMRANFAVYPRRWGLSRPDTNIDHRRVPNLQVFFQRKAKQVTVPQDTTIFQPGDLVTQMLPGNLPHIGIVSDKKSIISRRPLMIHNIGRGTLEEDVLASFPITGRYVMTA